MAIVTMKRFSLLAMQADKETIFDALIRSQVVHLKRSADIQSCTTTDVSVAREEILAKISRVEEIMAYVMSQVEINNATVKDKHSKVKVPKNSFSRPLTEVNFDYFLNFHQNVGELENQLENVEQLRSKIAELQALRTQKVADLNKHIIYRALPHPTTWYKSTDSVVVRLCQMPSSDVDKLTAFVQANYDCVHLQVIDATGDVAVVVAIVHKSQADFFEQATTYGLVNSNFVCDKLPQVVIEDLERQIAGIDEQINALIKGVLDSAMQIPQWKIYIDYLGLLERKIIADGDLQKTDQTFVMEAYYPADQEQKVQQVIESVSDKIVLNFFDIAEEEFAPTLVKNNGIVKQFEFITNAYTVPDYHEVDPNPMMSIFYTLIFGFMVADMGYGLVLVLAGLFAHFAIKQPSGIRTMLQLFGICGVGAIAVGALFGSFFSIALYPGLIPDPSVHPMVLMMISLGVGVLHIVAGTICNMMVKYKHKKKLSAWLTDFPWVIVFLSFIVAIFNLALDFIGYEGYSYRLPQIVSDIALYICLGSLAIAVIFAGFDTKGIIGKAMESFGKLYGLINYFSDIMSYIRVFGLMLSSALMGVVINQLGAMVASGGGIGYLFAVVLLVFAHLFNLVMGILGVYIHDGRLQYVEFFGKFYTGDGVLFSPFGSQTKYTLVKDDSSLNK